MSGRSTFIGAADGATTRIVPIRSDRGHNKQGQRSQGPSRPGHTGDRPDTGVQGRAIAARNASFPHVAAAINGSDLAALREQPAACGHLAARCQRQQVLINGRGGGSGIYAVQLARQQGPGGVRPIPPAAGLTLTGCLMCLPGHSLPGTRGPPQPVAADRPGSRRPGPGQPQADESAHRVPEMLASGSYAYDREAGAGPATWRTQTRTIGARTRALPTRLRRRS